MNCRLSRLLCNISYLLNPPGHGQVNIGNLHWQFHFPQYAQVLDESLRRLQSSHEVDKEKIIIAHSAGAEMVFQLLLNKLNKQAVLPKVNKIILINPWLPSISNVLIPWTSDDLLAHEKLTENFGGWWPLKSRFVRLMKATTRTQKNIFEQGRQYQPSINFVTLLNKYLSKTKTQLIIVSSARGIDQIIPQHLQYSLKIAFRNKLPDVRIKFIQGIKVVCFDRLSTSETVKVFR